MKRVVLSVVCLSVIFSCSIAEKKALRDPASESDWSQCGIVYECIYEIVLQQEFDNIGEFREELVAVKKDGQWGYLSLSEANWVIEPQYDEARGFSEGLAAVQKYGGWGYINKNQDWVIQPQFDRAWDFHEGLAAVQREGKWGYIDKASGTSGNWAIEPQFDEAWSFHNG